MGYIYAYSPDEDDCTSIGLVGALLPTDCTFSLEAGAFGELTLQHPKDTAGKWKALQTGVILKAPVPVRLCPEIRTDGTYITTVETWTVSETATSDDRKLYKKASNDKKSSTIPAGVEVTVLETSFTYERTRIKATVVTYDKRKRKKTTNYSGWIKTEVLTNKISSQTIPGNSSGSEDAVASYAVRDQLFRVYDVTVSDDENGSVDVKARRIVYDLLGNLSTYVNTAAEISGLDACQGILNNTVSPHDFSIYSDIADTRSALDCRDLNPIEALMAQDTGVVARWNGEAVSDDYDIYVLHRAGMDRGVTIAYGKNLTGITCEVDTSDIAIGIRPRGEKKDGSPLYLAGNETLPPGYSFGTGAHDRDVIYSNLSKRSEVIPKISPLTVSDAKISDKVNEALAKRRMISEAISQFEGACDVAAITMKVDFIMIGDTAEYSQYRHLESLFVYDTVHIRHNPLGISADISLVSMQWDCIAERVTEATFGSLQDVSASVASWQISSVSGGKIIPGTIGSSALQDEVICARHVQAESINTDALQAESITTEKLAAQAVTADKIQANTIETAALEAVIARLEHLTADDIETDRLTAAIANLGVLTVGDATIRKAIVETLLASALTVTDATEENVYIDNLMVKNAQMISATIGALIVKASDGRYYRLDFDGSGNIVPVATSVTEGEITSGVTTDGTHRIIETAMTVDDLGASSMKAITALINRLTAAQIDVGTLFANEAFISKLATSEIYGGQSFEIIVGEVQDSVSSVQVYYALSDSDRFPPSAGWSVMMPERDADQYVWQKTTTTFNSGRSTDSEPTCISGTNGEDATVLRIDSSRGTVFKNNTVSTVLSAVIYHGKERITDIDALHRVFGNGAYLQWSWQRMDDERFGVISAADTRLQQGGFAFLLSADDVDTKVTFMCELITD